MSYPQVLEPNSGGEVGSSPPFFKPDTSMDYRLGRYFDSMNNSATSTPNSSSSIQASYRSSLQYQVSSSPPTSSNQLSANTGLEGRMSNMSFDTSLPVIRPKRSDSVRSTDSRATTASSVSTLVPRTIQTEVPIQQQQLQQQQQQQQPSRYKTQQPPAQEEVIRSSIRSTASSSSTISSLSQPQQKRPSGRRVRFADDPPAEYLIEDREEALLMEQQYQQQQQQQQQQSQHRDDAPIMVVTKRLGPASAAPMNNSQNTVQNPPPPLLSLNRVPPPYPNFRQQQQPTSNHTVESHGVEWRDDGYDSVNQTPSEGSVNSTTSSSGVPASTSPDHQQFEPTQPTQGSPPNRFSTSSLTSSSPYTPSPSNYQSQTLQSTKLRQQPYLQRFDPYQPQSTYQPIHPPPSQPQPQPQMSTLPYSYRTSVAGALPQSSQYRWLPGRAPSSMNGSTMSLNTSTATLPKPQYQAPHMQMNRAPSFRQLQGPEPVCIVAEDEFSTLLDSLPLNGHHATTRVNGFM